MATLRIAVNEFGRRIGETHGRAKLSDHDVELIIGLLECREKLIEEYTKAGVSTHEVKQALYKAQLSYAGIAEKFEISKSHVQWIAIGGRRSQQAVRWKVIGGPKPDNIPGDIGAQENRLSLPPQRGK